MLDFEGRQELEAMARRTVERTPRYVLTKRVCDAIHWVDARQAIWLTSKCGACVFLQHDVA